MKKIALLLGMALFVSATFAQESATKNPCFRVSSFSSSIGFGGALTSNTETDYYHLKNAAENPGLFVDITGMDNTGSGWGFDMYYPNGGFYYNAGSGNGNLLFNLGLTPYSKKLGKYRDNRELRFSLGGSFGTRNNFYYYDKNSFVIDTLVSVNGDNKVYADSVINTNYGYTLNYSEINVGFSYLFKTDVNRRVHFYTGVGMNYGIALRSTVNFYKDTYRAVYYYNEFEKPAGDEDYFYYNNNSSMSSYSSSTGLKSPQQFARVFIPLGINLKLSKKSESFFNHVDLYSEINPGVEFQFLAGEKTYANPYVGVGFIGFRYHW